MQKTTLYLLLLLGVSPLVSFKAPEKNIIRNSYNIFYVDNSKSLTGSEPLSTDMIDLLQKKVDSVKAEKSAKIEYYYSNYFNPEHARNVENAKKLIDKLNSGYNGLPNSVVDISFLRSYIYTDDLSNVENVNICFFVTEYYLTHDLLGRNSGLLLNFLPKEVQYITKTAPENITVTVYYPKASKTVAPNAGATFTQGIKGYGGLFKTKIHFNFQPV